MTQTQRMSILAAVENVIAFWLPSLSRTFGVAERNITDIHYKDGPMALARMELVRLIFAEVPDVNNSMVAKLWQANESTIWRIRERIRFTEESDYVWRCTPRGAQYATTGRG